MELKLYKYYKIRNQYGELEEDEYCDRKEVLHYYHLYRMKEYGKKIVACAAYINENEEKQGWVAAANMREAVALLKAAKNIVIG